MNPYEPCWCRSGKKWKWCHKDRHLQTPPSIGQVQHNFHQEMQKGYCSHPDASPDTCGERIIRAHTVQRGIGLSAIAENGHVISVKSAFEDLIKNDDLVPREVGTRSASTFMGFCDRHDGEMFRPIERPDAQLTSQNCFLLSFRALAFEVFEKRTALRQVQMQQDMDKGKPFEIQCMIQESTYYFKEGMLIGLRDLERWKSDYDVAYRTQNFNSHNFFGVMFDGILPVMGCGAFYPEMDFQGSLLQKLGRMTTPCEHVTFNLTALNGRSVAVLGWTEGTAGPAATFVRSFASLDDSTIVEAAVRLAFEHLGNTFMKPSWWKDLAGSAKNAAIARMPSGGPSVSRRADCLLPDGHLYAAGVNVAERLGNIA